MRLAVVFFVLLISVAQAQQKDEQVIWDIYPTCSATNLQLVIDKQPTCDVQTVDGRKYYIISYSGISIAVNPRSRYHFVVVAVQISNNSGKDVYVDVTNSSIARFKDKASHMSKPQKGDHDMTISATRAKERAEANRSSGTGTAGQSPSSGLRADVVTSNSGVVAITPKAPIYGPTQSTVPKSVEATEKLFFQNELVSKGVLDKQKTAGYIFFEPNRSSNFAVISIKIDGNSFVFPILFQG